MANGGNQQQPAGIGKVHRERAKKADTPPLSPNEKPVLSISEAAVIGPYSQGALRHLIFQAEGWSRFPDGKQRRANGFEQCVIRPPGQRRIFIDRMKYLQWLTQNLGATK